MKTFFKLLLVLALSFAVLCQSQNEFSLQVDAISVSVSENLVPFFKVKENDNIYYLRLQSIYEIQQQNDSLWYRIPGSETLLSNLNWNISTNLADGTFALFGSPCPCEDAPPQQEPILGKRIVRGPLRRRHCASGSNCNGGGDGGGDGDGTTPPGNQGTDNSTDNGNTGNNNICPTVNFEYVKLFFQFDKNCSSGGSGGNGGNGGNNNVDPDQCNASCVTACDSAANATNCVAFCNSFYNVTYIDEAICNSTCIVDEVVDPDCLTACTSWSTCFNGTTGNPSTPEEPAACTLTLNYHLHKYTFSNLTTNATSGGSDFPNSIDSNIRLAFAFEVLQQPADVACRSFFDHWYEGPFNVQLNVSTLALENYPADDSNLDITNATQIESNLVYALRDDIIVGRIYVNQFADGFSIFNAPLDAVNNTPPAEEPAPAKRSIPYSLELVQPPAFAALRKSK